LAIRHQHPGPEGWPNGKTRRGWDSVWLQLVAFIERHWAFGGKNQPIRDGGGSDVSGRNKTWLLALNYAFAGRKPENYFPKLLRSGKPVDGG
jgi:hypothetical protein